MLTRSVQCREAFDAMNFLNWGKGVDKENSSSSTIILISTKAKD